MTKEPLEFAKDRMEYFREFHSVIAPVVVFFETVSNPFSERTGPEKVVVPIIFS